MCYFQYQIITRLVRVLHLNYDLTNYAAIQSVNFDYSQHPSNFCVYQDHIYYNLSNQIYKFNFSDTSLPTTPLFNPQVNNLYGLDVIDNQIFVCDAKDFITSGSLKVFNSSGALLTEKTTEIGPKGVYFN